jgi:hypothetical protein
MVERRLLLEASDLFNRKHYFECHDVLEDAWSGETGEDREFLQALIHASVGLYHVAATNHKGAASLLARAVEGLTPYAPERDGLDVDGLVARLRRCLSKTERALAGEPIEWTATDVPVMVVAALE